MKPRSKDEMAITQLHHTNLVSFRPIISEIATLKQRVIFAATRPQFAELLSAHWHSKTDCTIAISLSAD